MVTRRRKRARSTVLLLVDYINHFRFPRAAQLAPRAVRAARATASLKAAMTRQGCVCVYANDNFGEWQMEFSAQVRESLAKGDASGKIAALLRPTSRDLSILKPRNSAFYGTPLEFLLDELEASTLVIAGIAVDMCVLATAQDAHMRKFNLRVPSNCVAGFTRAEERSALLTMERTLHADTAPHRT
jgi:nicotinamidase-related amidase